MKKVVLVLMMVSAVTLFLAGAAFAAPEETAAAPIGAGAGLLGLAAAISVGLGAIGTAWAQSRIGAAAAAALAEKPELTATAVILVAIPETMVILGFVVAVLILLRGGG